MEPSTSQKGPPQVEAYNVVNQPLQSVEQAEEDKDLPNNDEDKVVKRELERRNTIEFPAQSTSARSYTFAEDDPMGKTSFFRSWLVAKKMFIIPKKYSLLQVMGKGSYGIVCKAKTSDSDQPVAIKKMLNPFKIPGNIIRILREIKLLKFLNHENIIQIKDLFPAVSVKSLESIYVVTEFMESDLMQIIHSSNVLGEDEIRYILFQILSALKYLHSANILHRDLKPSNILINSEWEIKIWDLGMARAMSSKELSNKDLTVYVTTRIYRAPELMFVAADYTQAIDVWSVGWILAEMLIRRPLFNTTNHIKQASMIYNLVGDLDEIENSVFGSKKAFFESLENRKDPEASFDKIFANYSEDVKDLLRKMLRLNPDKRITIEEWINHPYFDEYEDERADLENWSRTFDTEFEERENTEEQLKADVLNEIFSFAPKIDEDIFNRQNQEYKILKRWNKVHHTL